MSMHVSIRKQMVSADRHFGLDIEFDSASRRIALFGPSGAGKSLTLRAIAGLLTPDSGRIVLNGRTLFDADAGIDVRPQERRVAYLFQEYALFPHLTVGQNIGFGLARGWRNPRRGAAHPQAQRWIDAFGLADIAGNLPGRTQTLSVAIYEAVQAGDDNTANLLVLVTSVTCIAILVVAGRLVPATVRNPAEIYERGRVRRTRPAQ